ncbi:MAG TPA: immune inhibitor A domain-containing protein [Acidimicrobiales bacterium]|nr:immune inhibitor A domain-containing protein [Acidimicrobiales bacterium]
MRTPPVLARSLAAAAALSMLALGAPAMASPSVPAVPTASAAPAAPAGARWGEFVDATDTALVVTQPDGSSFRARMTDADVGGALEVDGYSIVKGADGWWRFAERRGAHGLEAGGARVGVDQRPVELAPGVGRVATVWSDGQGGDVRTELLRQLQTASRQASLEAAANGGPRVFRFPVVLFATWYDAEAGQSSPQFQVGNDVAHYQAILDGFGGNPTGTLTEFYFENSYGQFLVQVDVLARPDGRPYVSNRSSVPGDEGRCYYGGIDPPENPADDLDPLDQVIGAGGGGALGMGIELFNTTTLPVDHQFAKYDNDGDGSIDFMGIIHSGAEMAVTGDPCNTWSHAISVSTFTSIAGTLLQGFGLPVPDTGMKAGLPVPGQAVTYDRLFTMPEFETKTGTLTIGVAAHEMAHALGEPDYYGTDGSTSGNGDWDIMAGGSYGGTPSGSNPTWFNPATRVFQGWVTPTIVHEDAVDYTLERRSKQPAEGYAVGTPDPNLVLVPTRWVQVGDETSDGHVWTENDVHGLVQDGDRGYVIEGWYLELAGRMPTKAPGIHAGMTRESYFDRWLYGSGLLTWHFDYWRRSNVLHGQNGANNDPNRMQMDVEEWDFNDNTQEIALNRNRAEASDVAWEAATGITSGTHRPNPAVPAASSGDPQAGIDIPPGPVTPVTPYDFAFEVEDNPANRTMRVTVAPALGDCTLQLLYGPAGQETEQTEVVDAGFVQAPEVAIVTNPKPGRWVARVGDFAACASASGTIEFEGQGAFDATGTADTWTFETEAPTGWAFTNIRTGGAEGLSHGTDAGGDGTLTLDIVQLLGETDVSPGFARPAGGEALDGRRPVSVGTANAFEVPIFSNGSEAPGTVAVEVREGSATGPVVASGSVELGGYEQVPFAFTYDPGQEGGFDLVTIVDPDDAVDEAVEGNDVQKASGWAGPADPSVLIVDDDGSGDTEQAYAGALSALGIPYAIAEKHVTAAEMGAYDAVIWASTLDRGPGQLDEADRDAIAAYLGDGGKLWLASNRAIEALILTEAVDFGAQWFGVTSADIDSFYDTVQMETTDILGSHTLDIDVLAGRPFVDKFVLSDQVQGTATSLGVLQGSGSAATPGDGVAILGARVEGDAAAGGFQTAVTSFSLSQIRQPGDAIDVVEAIMGHFGVATGQYTAISDDPIVFHSQPRQTVSGVDLPVKAVVVGGAAGQPVRLSYQHHGSGEVTTVEMIPSGDDGGYLGTIPAADVTPDGIDYFLRAGEASTYVPRLAEGGHVLNAIAVFMPEVGAAAAPIEPAAAPVVAESAVAASPVRLPATGGGSLAALGGLALSGWLGLRRLQPVRLR